MNKRVLVLDDDLSVRNSLKKVLADAGYEVALAADGGQAEGKFDGIDLLILDLNLPSQDGWDVLGRVNAEYPLLPVVLITGMMDQLDTTMIPGAGALLAKPIEAPVLLKTIERLLAQTADERLRGMSGSAERLQARPARPGVHESSWRSRGFRGFRC